MKTQLKSVLIGAGILAIVVTLATSVWLLTRNSSVSSAAAPSGNVKFLVTNWGEDTISVVDITEGKELARVAAGMKPFDAVTSPDGSLAYISNSGEASLSVLDLQTYKIVETIQVGRSPRDSKITPDGKMLAVANSGADSVSLVNLETNQEVAQIPVGRLPYGVAITPDGSTLYVNNWGENTVSVVDLLALKEVNKISVGGLPYTIVMNPNGEVVYVSNFASNSISVLSTATNETIATVPITGRSPWGIALSPDGHTLASANFHSGDVSLVAVNPHYLESARIDLRFESENVPTGTFAAKNIRYVSTGALIVVSNLASNEIRVIDTAKGKVVRTIKVGQAPYGLAELTPHASTGK